MANIKEDLEKNKAETVYYLFRPDTLLKTYGDLTFVFNPILNGWTSTSNIESYIQTGTEFKIIDEETLKEVIEAMTDNIILKKEFTPTDIEDLIFGKAKLQFSVENQSRQDIVPKVFEEDLNKEGINIKRTSLRNNIIGICLIVVIVINLALFGMLFSKNKADNKDTICEPFLKTITYHIGDKLETDFSYYNSCGNNTDFRTINFKNVDIEKAGIYLYTGIDKNGTEKTGTIIVED